LKYNKGLVQQIITNEVFHSEATVAEFKKIMVNASIEANDYENLA
jgi:hypothetical protein